MKKYYFLGIVSGLMIVIILRSIISNGIIDYLGIIIGSFTASLIGQKRYLGGMLALLIVVSEAIPFYLLMNESTLLLPIENHLTMLKIYFIEILCGISGGWIGASFLKMWKQRQHRNTSM